MPDSIADALILTMPAGRSLAQWHARGTLDRERAMLEVFKDHYPRIIIVTHGGPEDLLAAQALRRDGEEWLDIIPTDADTADRTDPLTLDRVRSSLSTTGVPTEGSVVLQTMQLDDGGLASRIAPGLKRAGYTVAVVARGGYLPSRVHAAERGPHTQQALGAGDTERRIARLASVIIGPTHGMLDDLSWRHGIDPARTRMIPNFILEPGEPLPAQERDPATLLTCSALVPRKRIDRLVRMMVDLPDDMKGEVKLDVIGEGPLRMELTALAEELDVRVEFLGFRPHDEVRERMRKCTAFVLASSFETHPRPLIEAMANGAPAVVAQSPGLAEHVENGVTGVIVPGNPESFSYALAGVLPDADWRDMLGSTASQKIRVQCDLTRVMHKTTQAHISALEVVRRNDRRAA